MKIDNSFSNRVSLARTSAGLTQGQLAEMVGIVRRQIAAYEAGTSKPRDKVLANLAAALGTSVEWLSSGVGSGPDLSNIKRTVTVKEIPLLSWVQAIMVADGDQAVDGSVSNFIAAPPGAGERSFAVEIQGDSMDAPYGVSFPAGTIVSFDPDLVPGTGDYVLCSSSEDNEATFKQIIADQGKLYLKPLNHLYMAIELTNDVKILAVAFHSQTDLLKINHHDSWKNVDLWGGQLRELPVVEYNQPMSERLSEIEGKLDEIMSLLLKK